MPTLFPCEKKTFKLHEEQRQIVVLALAELSIARPGWVNMLEEIAILFDNRTVDGRAQMFEQFRNTHINPVTEILLK